jgi:hypothetical protein
MSHHWSQLLQNFRQLRPLTRILINQQERPREDHMKPRKHYAIAALASLALAVTLGACSTGAEQKTITVTAHSRVTVVPDVARITVSVVTEGKDAASA